MHCILLVIECCVCVCVCVYVCVCVCVYVYVYVCVCVQVNVAPNTVMASRMKKAQVRATRQSKPVYLHSQD